VERANRRSYNDSGETVQDAQEVSNGARPDPLALRVYIADMAGQLAELAAGLGDAELAEQLRFAAARAEKAAESAA